MRTKKHVHIYVNKKKFITINYKKIKIIICCVKPML